MTDQPQGPDWWQAADLKWYPPELHADYEEPPPPPPDEQPQQPADLKLAATPQHPWAPVPQPGPANQQPPKIGTPPLSERRQPKRPTAPLIAAIVVILAAGVGITGYLLRRPSTTSQPSTTLARSATPPTVPPVAENALQGLLLSPDQINTAMGATGMTASGPLATEMHDARAAVSDTACLPVAGVTQAAVYAGRRWSAVRSQDLTEPDNSYTHSVTQGVVLFSSANDAGAFFTASAQQWPACSNRQYIVTLVGHPAVWTVGPISNTNGTLSATTTSKDDGISLGTTCQQALTVSNNVAIDVSACGYNLSDAAVNIAQQIAAKVPTT